MRKRAELLFIAAGLALAWPSAAHAATTCAFPGPGPLNTLTLTMTAAGDRAALSVGGGNAIEVRDRNFDPVGCPGSPTTANTELIVVEDTSAGRTEVEVRDANDFVGPANEIDFTVQLGPGTGDRLDLIAVFGAVNWRFGTAGININSNETTDDLEYTMTGVERFGARSGFDDDVISAAGGEGTGARFARPLEFTDTFGDDVLVGGRRRDVFNNGSGADVMRGGPGRDTVDYCCFLSEDLDVRVSLGRGANDGAAFDESESVPRRFDNVRGDIENVITAFGDDVLIGNRKPNLLVGGVGRDRYVAKGGRDRVRARDFTRDRRIDCGPGRDRVRRDPFDLPGVSC